MATFGQQAKKIMDKSSERDYFQTMTICSICGEIIERSAAPTKHELEVHPEIFAPELTLNSIIVSSPSGPEPKKVTQDDVWGRTSDPIETGELKRFSWGMIVARGLPSLDPKYFTAEERDHMRAELTDICPVWGDQLGYKSCTVICTSEQEADVTYWLEYVHGGGSISRRQELGDGRVALRSNYMCW